MSEPRLVYFILETEYDPERGYIPCIAKEGEKGYYRTDWYWGHDLERAHQLCDERNQMMGIDRQEAMRIQLRTM